MDRLQLLGGEQTPLFNEIKIFPLFPGPTRCSPADTNRKTGPEDRSGRRSSVFPSRRAGLRNGTAPDSSSRDSCSNRHGTAATSPSGCALRESRRQPQVEKRPYSKKGTSYNHINRPYRTKRRKPTRNREYPPKTSRSTIYCTCFFIATTFSRTRLGVRSGIETLFKQPFRRMIWERAGSRPRSRPGSRERRPRSGCRPSLSGRRPVRPSGPCPT